MSVGPTFKIMRYHKNVGILRTLPDLERAGKLKRDRNLTFMVNWAQQDLEPCNSLSLFMGDMFEDTQGMPDYGYY